MGGRRREGEGGEERTEGESRKEREEREGEKREIVCSSSSTHDSTCMYHTTGGMPDQTHPDIQLVLKHSLLIENTNHLHPER